MNKKVYKLFQKMTLLTLCCLLVCNLIVSAYATSDATSDDIFIEKKSIDAIWRNENYCLLSMANESWFNTLLICSDLYQVLTNFAGWNASGTIEAYKDALVDLIYIDENYIDKLLDDVDENISETSVFKAKKDLLNDIPTLDENSGYKIEVLDDVLGEVDRFFYVSKNIWKLVKIATGSDEVSRALNCVSAKGNGNVKRAAEFIIEEQDDIRNGKAGSAVVRSILSDEGAKKLLDEASDVVLKKLWKNAVSIEADMFDKYWDTGTQTSTILKYHSLAYIQSEIENVLNVTRISDYESKEEFIEDYRALSYTYVMCAYEANSLFKDWNGVDQEKWEQVESIFVQSLTEILAVGTNNESHSMIQLTEYDYPVNLQYRDTYVCYGKLSTSDGSPLPPVSVQILTVDEMIVMDVSSGDIGTVNSYDIANLDSRITLNTLQPNIYIYRIKAGEEILLNKIFLIQEEDNKFVITGYRLPHPQAQGSTFSVTGTVYSNQPMFRIEVGIYDVFGNWITGDSAIPNATEYNLSNLDCNTRFDWLQSGNSYYYRITAVSYDNEEVLVNQPFYVY